MIFYLLRSIRSECLLHDFSGKLKLDTLEVSYYCMASGQLMQLTNALRLKIRFVFRDLVLIDRATCRIASRASFFYTKICSPLAAATERAKRLEIDLSKLSHKI